MDLFEHLHGAFAENTLRAYRADFKVFSTWCESNEIAPLSANPNEVASFIEAQAQHHRDHTSAHCQYFHFAEAQQLS